MDNKILKATVSLSIAECNCILEAIEEANKQVAAGNIVYVKDGYQPETCQEQYAGVTNDIAAALQTLIEAEQTALIIFEP